MMLQTLINAATLKGYLKATDGDADAIAMAQAIVDAEIARLSDPVASVPNEDVRMPEPETTAPLASLIIEAVETAPSHDESRFAETEAPVETDKHARYREKCRAEGRCPHCGKPCAPYAECEERRKAKVLAAHGQEEYRRPEGHGQRAPRQNSVLEGKIKEIQLHLATESFGVVGHRYGVSGETVKNFLKRNGVDIVQYRKVGGRPIPTEPDGQVTDEDEAAHAAQETAQGEENERQEAGEVAAEQTPRSRSAYCWKPEAKKTLLDMKAHGSGWREIAEAVGKTVSQSRAMYHLLRKTAERAGSEQHTNSGLRGGRGSPKLFSDDLPVILRELQTCSFGECGELHGVTGHAIIDFLKRNGVNHEPFKKNPGYGVRSSNVEGDDWPEPVKPKKTMVLTAACKLNECARDEAVAKLLAAMPAPNDRKNSRLKRDDIPRILKFLERQPMSLVAKRLGESANTIDNLLERYGIDYRTLPEKIDATKTTTEMPRMRFETVKVKDGWGNESERQVAVPIGKYKDPETGVKVTKYPPGYAIGAFPQRSAPAKGGA